MAPIITKSKKRSKNRKQLGSTGHAIGSYSEDAISLARRTMSGLNEIRKLINIESKIIDTNATRPSIPATGTVTCLTQVAQGLDYANRVGDSIRLQNLTLRARLFVNGSATNSVIRVVVFRDLDGYGTAPTFGTVMDSLGGNSNPLASTSWLNRDRFSILFDEFLTLDVNGTQSMPLYYHSAHQGHVKYLGTTAAAASNGKGSIYLLFVADEATNTPTIAWNARVEFTDD